MSTSGTYLADPTLADFGDEAFERAGILPRAITADHIASLRRSIAFLLSGWSVTGPRQWKFSTLAHTVTAAETSFDLPFGMIDVKTVTLTRGAVETEMLPMARAEYRVLHNKTVQGRPSTYFVNRRRGTQDSPAPTTPMQFFYWQAAENSTDIITVEYYSQIEDQVTGSMRGTFDLPFRWHEPFAAELAARLAQKWKPERYADLRIVADKVTKDADGEDTEKNPLFISVDYRGRNGRR